MDYQRETLHTFKVTYESIEGVRRIKRIKASCWGHVIAKAFSVKHMHSDERLILVEFVVPRACRKCSEEGVDWTTCEGNKASAPRGYIRRRVFSWR